MDTYPLAFLLTDGNWDWKEVLSLAIAAVAVIVSAVTMYFSKKTADLQGLTASASLFTTLANTYDSPEMRSRRQRFAKALSEPETRENLDLYNEDSVLDFFEEIGYLVRRKILDEEMVWHHFFWHFERYYRASTEPTDLLKAARAKHRYPALYSETEWLFGRLVKLREKGTEERYKPPADADVESFLEGESALIRIGGTAA